MVVETDASVRIGTAGWSIPARFAGSFPDPGPHLQRYAGRFTAAEINSSFHRPHRPTTYARWAASVPEEFRFSVKLPREITHRRKLVDTEEPLDRFCAEIAALGFRLGPVLVQLPPSLAFDPAAADPFFTTLRQRVTGGVVCEPRHPSWFAAEAGAMLCTHRVARVAADPAIVPAAAEPGGWPGLVYYRWHGSPRIYHSGYEAAALDRLAAALRARAAPVWCMFDNTASRAAAGDALALAERLRSPPACQAGSSA